MRDTNDPHYPINAIEAYVKQTRDKFRSEDLYIHFARTLYAGLGREDEVTAALDKHRPQVMPEVPSPVLGCCAGTENTRLAIEHCLDTEEHGLLPYGWQYSTQQDVSRLCIALAEVKEGDTVLMPFFGLGNDATMLPQEVSVQGYEIDKRVWALARINLWAHAVDGTGVKCADAFKELAYIIHILMISANRFS
ncbi:MAG: hypothetical protein LIP02_09485 [Bacteroidales bacterium]|nr:hypothetical protein [Bacteroidales bacterium]